MGNVEPREEGLLLHVSDHRQDYQCCNQPLEVTRKTRHPKAPSLYVWRAWTGEAFLPPSRVSQYLRQDLVVPFSLAPSLPVAQLELQRCLSQGRWLGRRSPYPK